MFKQYGFVRLTSVYVAAFIAMSYLQIHLKGQNQSIK